MWSHTALVLAVLVGVAFSASQYGQFQEKHAAVRAKTQVWGPATEAAGFSNGKMNHPENQNQQTQYFKQDQPNVSFIYYTPQNNDDYKPPPPPPPRHWDEYYYSYRRPPPPPPHHGPPPPPPPPHDGRHPRHPYDFGPPDHRPPPPPPHHGPPPPPPHDEKQSGYGPPDRRPPPPGHDGHPPPPPPPHDDERRSRYSDDYGPPHHRPPPPPPPPYDEREPRHPDEHGPPHHRPPPPRHNRHPPPPPPPHDDERQHRYSDDFGPPHHRRPPPPPPPHDERQSRYPDDFDPPHHRPPPPPHHGPPGTEDYRQPHDHRGSPPNGQEPPGDNRHTGRPGPHDNGEQPGYENTVNEQILQNLKLIFMEGINNAPHGQTQNDTTDVKVSNAEISKRRGGQPLSNIDPTVHSKIVTPPPSLNFFQVVPVIPES